MYRHSIDSTNSIHVNVLVVFANGCSVLCCSSGSSWLEIPVNRWCIRCTNKLMTSDTLRYKKAAIKATTHKQLQLKGPVQLRNIKSILYRHGLYNFRQKNSRSKFSSVTLLSLTPFWTSYWLTHSAESFVIFSFLSHGWSVYIFIFVLLSVPTLRKMTKVTRYDLQLIWSTEIALERKNQK